MRKSYLVLFSLSFLSATLFAQKPTRIELLHANSLEGDNSLGKNVRRLLGDVQFKHDNALMFCDSAYFYSDQNSLDAFSNVRIVQGDSMTLTGSILKYNGDTKQAQIFTNVRMTDRKMILTTETLNYNMNTDVADYNDGGKIVDTENTLTSKIGNYFSKDRLLFFKRDVVLVNPRYVMKTDTLKYNTVTKTAFFEGPCFINSTEKDSSVIYCETGWYNTITEQSYFGKNAYIQSKEQILRGDSILYNKKRGIGESFKNVSITDTIEKIIVTGEYGRYDEVNQTSRVTGKSMLTKIFEKDSLYLHADTLFANADTIKKTKTYFAYNHVRVFKSDLQGKCDSLVYSTSDSLVKFYSDPVLWTDKNQLTGDFISLQISGNKLSTMNITGTSFIASQQDTLRFNQVKGKNMTGYFLDNKLYKIFVEGNGQTIYYGKNKKEELVGVNRADCTDMLIFINENKIKRITMINKPDPTFYPIRQLAPNELLLKGFNWLEEKRPVSKEDIFNWR